MFGFKTFELEPVTFRQWRVNREAVDEVFAGDVDDVTPEIDRPRSPEAVIDLIDETLELLAIAMQESLERQSTPTSADQ